MPDPRDTVFWNLLAERRAKLAQQQDLSAVPEVLAHEESLNMAQSRDLRGRDEAQAKEMGELARGAGAPAPSFGKDRLSELAEMGAMHADSAATQSRLKYERALAMQEEKDRAAYEKALAVKEAEARYWKEKLAASVAAAEETKTRQGDVTVTTGMATVGRKAPPPSTGDPTRWARVGLGQADKERKDIQAAMQGVDGQIKNVTGIEASELTKKNFTGMLAAKGKQLPPEVKMQVYAWLDLREQLLNKLIKAAGVTPQEQAPQQAPQQAPVDTSNLSAIEKLKLKRAGKLPGTP